MSVLVSDAIEALYIHIPFCASRCNYCAFATRAVPKSAGIMPEYAAAVSRMVEHAGAQGFLDKVKTAYIGGGTPSFLGADALKGIVSAVASSVPHALDEFTVEANPDSFTGEFADELVALGASRFSLGVQSFRDAELHRLGRIHDAAEAEAVLASLAARQLNFSGDLICGIDGQDMDSWKESVRRMAGLGASHVSVYPLAVEEGTPLAARIAQGRMAPPDDDFEADCMQAASDILCEAGFERYEVASYARPGMQSQHNTAYWSGLQYLGIGTGAASMATPRVLAGLCEGGIVDGAVLEGICEGGGNGNGCGSANDGSFGGGEGIVRFSCAQQDVEFACGGPMHVEAERLGRRAAACEQAMLRMRMTRGISHAELSEALCAAPGIGGAFEECAADGLCVGTGASGNGGGYVPTQRGWMLGNIMYGRIWDMAEQDCNA